MGWRENVRVVQLLRDGSWNNNARNCPSAYRNLNQPDNANNPDNATNHVGFRVVCLPQHPSRSAPLERIPAAAPEASQTQESQTQGSQTRGSRPIPEIRGCRP